LLRSNSVMSVLHFESSDARIRNCDKLECSTSCKSPSMLTGSYVIPLGDSANVVWS